MQSKALTVTSKNQITLPIEFVRNMDLDRNRVLHAELRGGSIILTPQPTLAITMQKFWRKHKASHPLTDKELKEATRTSAASHLA